MFRRRNVQNGWSGASFLNVALIAALVQENVIDNAQRKINVKDMILRKKNALKLLV